MTTMPSRKPKQPSASMPPWLSVAAHLPLFGLITFLLAIFFIQVPTLGQKKSQVRWWRGSFDAAIQEAKERNVPLFIALIQEGEEANERLVDDVFTNKNFVAITKNAVPVLANKGSHGSKSQLIGGVKKEVCRRMGGATCEQHQDLEARIFREFFVGEEALTPQVMVCRINLKLVERIVDVAGPRAYADAVKKAKKLMGPGLDAAMFKVARGKITRGRNLIRMGQYRQAWDEISDLAKIGGPSPLVKKAIALHKKVEAKVNGALEAAYAAADRNDYWTALGTLERVAREFKGTPPAKKAEAAFKRLSKTKDGSPVARQLKKQKRYLPWMARARAHETRGEYQQARKLYRRVKAKAKKLPVAQQAEERLAYFRSESAIAALLKVVDQENEAKALLKEATKKARDGDLPGAKVIYHRILKEYPGTKAAKKAQSKL